MPAELLNGTGSVASLIGAAMETAGYQAQSQLLNTFNNGLAAHLGGLLYLIGFLGAIITIAVGGSYRYGLWFLIGPPLFFYLIQTREPTAPANWQFGDRMHTESQVRIVEGARKIGDEARNVSLFFKFWNRLTSEVIQELIRLLHLTEKGSDLDFINKSDIYFSFWKSATIDPALKGFINITLINKCSSYFYLLRMISDPYVPDIQKGTARETIARIIHEGENEQINLNDHLWYREWIEGLEIPGVIKDKYTCPELWTLAIEIFKKIGKRELELKIQSILPPGLSADQRLATLKRKCDQIILNGGIVREQALNDSDCTQVLINEIAARTLAKEFSNVSKNLIALDLNEHQQIMGRQRMGGLKYSQETSTAIRELAITDEYMHRGELIAGAMTLPYIQGMVLYFLAFSFPFFALFLVVPGRESGLFTWMGLWLWVKLWDFGFAVVMLIDNILYALLPHGPILSNEVLEKPGEAFKALFATDPAFSSYTYYNLVACCLFAVPIITGALVAKGGGELVNAISQGWKEFPRLFAHVTSNFHRSMLAQQKMKEVNDYIASKVQAKAWSYLTNDPEVGANLLKSAALKIAASQGNMALNQVSQLAKLKDFNALQSSLGSEGAAALVKEGLDLLSGQHKQIALQKLNFELQREAFNASNDSFSRYQAERTVMLNYWSHDFRRFYPTDQFFDYALATRNNIFAGKMADGLVNKFSGASGRSR